MQLTRQRDRDGLRPGSRRRECEHRAALSARETRSGCRTEGRHGLRQREAVLSSVDSRGAKSLNLQLSLNLHRALLAGDALLEPGCCRHHVAPTCQFSHGTKTST